jgi:hypothetical protein
LVSNIDIIRLALLSVLHRLERLVELICPNPLCILFYFRRGLRDSSWEREKGEREEGRDGRGKKKEEGKRRRGGEGNLGHKARGLGS